MQLELKGLRLERETDCSKTGRVNQARDARIVFGGVRSPDLAHFVNGKNDFDHMCPNFYSSPAKHSSASLPQPSIGAITKERQI